MVSVADNVSESLDFEALIKKFSKTKEVTEDKYLYLRDFRYVHDKDLGHTLVDRSNNDQYVLYGDTPIRQLCKIVKVPFDFLKRNPNYLNDDIMDFWLSETLKQAEEKSNGTHGDHKLFRVFKKNSVNYVRAIVDYDVSIVNNIDILDLVRDTFKSAELTFVKGTDFLDSVLNFRVSLEEKFDPGDGEVCHLGLHIKTSELGVSKFVLDSLIYRPVCDNGLIVKYGGKPYFSSNYKGVATSDLSGILSNSLERMNNDLSVSLGNLRKSVEEKVTNSDVRSLFNKFKTQRGLNPKFMEMVEGRASLSENLWQVVNNITNAAKELPTDQRVKYERFAGDLLQLDFKVN